MGCLLFQAIFVGLQQFQGSNFTSLHIFSTIISLFLECALCSAYNAAKNREEKGYGPGKKQGSLGRVLTVGLGLGLNYQFSIEVLFLCELFIYLLSFMRTCAQNVFQSDSWAIGECATCAEYYQNIYRVVVNVEHSLREAVQRSSVL